MGGGGRFVESSYNVWTSRDDRFYLYNGVSGAVISLSVEDRRRLDGFLEGEDVEISPALLEKLALGRMLVTKETDEIALLERRYRDSAGDQSALALTLVTSLGCNFDCPYCFEAKHPSLMSEAVQGLILRLVEDRMEVLRQLQVTWFGGEPLVGKGALYRLSQQLLDKCQSADVVYSAGIVTNGYLLDRSTSERLRSVGVDNAQIGLDGPPEIHDRMRPLRSGRGTFWTIVENLKTAVDILDVTVRINVDKTNIDQTEELLILLAEAGLANKLSVNLGQIVALTDYEAAPSATFRQPCLTSPEFAEVELRFRKMAQTYGFDQPSVPSPVATPCTAVRPQDLVVGSKGELYKCWDSVGNPHETIGTIADYGKANTRVNKWLQYDPFADAECRQCIALPVCMGGCAHHSFQPDQHESRCSTFRHTYSEQVEAYVDATLAPKEPVMLSVGWRR